MLSKVELGRKRKKTLTGSAGNVHAAALRERAVELRRDNFPAARAAPRQTRKQTEELGSIPLERERIAAAATAATAAAAAPPRLFISPPFAHTNTRTHIHTHKHTANSLGVLN